MSGPMVRAILEGRKTQTRRVVKPLPPSDAESVGANSYTGPEGPSYFWWKGVPTDGPVPYDGSVKYWPSGGSSCPYGKPGDWLWVRETWSPWADAATRAVLRSEDLAVYKADYREGCPPLEVGGCATWRPSIFMPRKFSRITLEITAVHVERLQKITEEDAHAEGVEPRIAGQDSEDKIRTYRTGYVCLWNSLNAKRGLGWEKNQWVWVVSFRNAEEAKQ